MRGKAGSVRPSKVHTTSTATSVKGVSMRFIRGRYLYKLSPAIRYLSLASPKITYRERSAPALLLNPALLTHQNSLGDKMSLSRGEGRCVGPPNTDEVSAHHPGWASNRSLSSLGGAPRERRRSLTYSARPLYLPSCREGGCSRKPSFSKAKPYPIGPVHQAVSRPAGIEHNTICSGVG